MLQNNNFNMIANLKQRAEEIGKLDRILAKGLYHPFNCANSGPRKLMHGTHIEHTVEVEQAEVPCIGAGYDIQYGEYNSSFIREDGELEVLAIIPKFSFNPKMVYYIIFADHTHNLIKVMERKPYEHTNEMYGYSYNTSYLDMLEPGYIVPKNSILRKSNSYDDYNNRIDGINAYTMYINTEKNMEDSIIVSESFSKKASTIKIGVSESMINSNDIPLNLYGDRENYKSFPDIGEEIKDGVVIAVRRTRNDESEFTQSYDMLSKIMMSDDIREMNGVVYDIDINVNDPEILRDTMYNRQLYKYYLETVRFQNEVVSTVQNIKSTFPDYKIDYKLGKMNYKCEQLLAGAKYTKDRGKEFSNCRIVFHVKESVRLNIGDKMANRYGGKGVISYIFPDCLMPYNPYTDQFADVILSSNTCTNRENPGQIFEIHLNSASEQVVNMMIMQKLDTQECISWIKEFLNIVVPQEAIGIDEMIEKYGINSEEIDTYVQSVLENGIIKISTEPITESISIDTLDALYKAFPFIQDPVPLVPIKNARGKYRLKPARRKVPFGKLYMYRLKQHSEDKFTVTSLSSTNIRGLNTKSKANKEHRVLHGKTPIQFGNMESGDMGAIGMEYIITILMIHSVSPHARRLIEDAVKMDPYDIDIRLDDESSNRNVEIINAYLKTIGIRLIFKKIPKVFESAMESIYNDPKYYDPFIHSAMYRFHTKLLTQQYINQFEKEEAFKKKVLEEQPFIEMAANLLSDEQLEQLREFGEIE